MKKESVLLGKVYEKSACGVGFLCDRKGVASHQLLQQAVHALCCVEHRGACGADNVSGDGAGIMADIPFELFGYERGEVAVAALFIPPDPQSLRLSLKVFEETFSFMGLRVLEYRDVPIDPSVLGEEARRTLPAIKHAIIERPKFCRTDESFNQLLYLAKQRTRTKERDKGIVSKFFFTSLSTTTIVYKGLVKAPYLARFYLDLQDPAFKTRFALFHRRFSTNTRTSWDKAQPFRLISHNGEINTIAGNRAWSFSREHSLGLPADEMLTHEGISDSGSLNEMVEALKYRSSIPRVEDILAIMMPPADQNNSFYKFWSRAMEPWDGPALITYSDGRTIGARLDRNGFRPCRWAMTDEYFYLCSEAGAFAIDESKVLSKGALHAGSGLSVTIANGEVQFEDPSLSRENYDAHFEPRLIKLDFPQKYSGPQHLAKKFLFDYTQEDFERVLTPMIMEGKEGIGSMGDTARPAFLSSEPRPFFDYFYEDFAQVTNPPLDYLREAMVTDLVTHVGSRPNIFSPKELIPPVPAIELSSPVLSLEQMGYFEKLPERPTSSSRIAALELDTTFKACHSEVGFRSALRDLAEKAVAAVESGCQVLILSDRTATADTPAVPALLALCVVVNALNREGIRLDASVIVHSAEVRSTHQVAVLIGFGATAVCPYLALEIARYDPYKAFIELDTEAKERNLVKSLESGLLKIMSKMGISVVRSYQGSKLFTCLGLGKELFEEFFPGGTPAIGGIGVKQLVDEIVRRAEDARAREATAKLLNTYQFKEQPKGAIGERHSMTNARSRIIHQLVRSTGLDLSSTELYAEYLRLGEDDEPVNLRHLLKPKRAESPLPVAEVLPREEILKRFGSGAMSFGAISAEAQRDIIRAMRAIGGRSNSGEGGENPYYYMDGTTASFKQVASGRFGVTAEYLASGEGYQIKIAQGAKPGEGGQLMGVKITPEIARARHSTPGVDLISPPPLHDIYSIEDLKQLIYELKQFKPEAQVSVKLVAGANIGTIAVGVAKAGADVIHVAGHDGGTGAAPLSSMKHAGIPWEFGLAEVHRALVSNNLRSKVILRVDGGLSSGRDIVTAAIFGADEFEFGKILLVSQGCVMARICEKNTCPTGIATHDPKFKAKYKGTVEAIVALLSTIADDVRRNLAEMGVRTLQELRGRGDLLELNQKHFAFMQQRDLDLTPFLECHPIGDESAKPLFDWTTNALNLRIVEECRPALEDREAVRASFDIGNSDRAVPAALSAAIAGRIRDRRAELMRERGGLIDTFDVDIQGALPIDMTFRGSAGQGFAVFLTEGVTVRLFGEANDSVAKSMSGGRIVIRPFPEATFDPARNTIIGNCALYGATGGTAYVHGLAGDRFAVRNSGATAVVEGTGLHACEYMTNGTVVILGAASYNAGAGMTGGTLFLRAEYDEYVNKSYVEGAPLSAEDAKTLRAILEDYVRETWSTTARSVLENWEAEKGYFAKYQPKRKATAAQAIPADGGAKTQAA